MLTSRSKLAKCFLGLKVAEPALDGHMTMSHRTINNALHELTFIKMDDDAISNRPSGDLQECLRAALNDMMAGDLVHISCLPTVE